MPDVDNHLLDMLEARRSLIRHWRRQHHDRKLRNRIPNLGVEAERYTDELTRENWHGLCDKLQGTLGTVCTWSILHHLLNPKQSKSQTTSSICRIIHASNQPDDKLLKKLKDRYLPKASNPVYTEYSGRTADDLDRDVAEAKVCAALGRIRRNSVSGPDRNQYKILKNLHDQDVQDLAALVNAIWRKGRHGNTPRSS